MQLIKKVRGSKMKENVVFLVIDSLLYTRLGFKRDLSPTPFIDEVVKKSIYADNMYSQGPFTEAAIMSLLTSSNTMDNGGYYKKLKYARKNIGEVFSENGYDTFHQFQPHIYPSSMKKGFSSHYYSVGFDINALWEYRLKYLSNLYNRNELDEKDFEDIVDFLEDNFKEWILYLESLRDSTEDSSLISKNLEYYDAQSSLDIVKDEYTNFLVDKRKYAELLLRIGKANKLFSVPLTNQIKVKDACWKNNFIKNHRKFFEKTYKINKKMNLINNRISLKQIRNIILNDNSDECEGKSKQILRYMNNYKKSILAKDIMDRIGDEYDEFKPSPSLYSHLEHFKQWQNKRNTDKPFMAYIHVDDIHTPANFFSYDIEDDKILDEEFDALNKFLDNIPSNYKGSIVYDYGLIYVDLCIKRFVNWLKDKSLLDNTKVVITADHGFSFTYDPIRKNSVNNFYDENYRIPFIMFGSGCEYKKIEKLSSSVDVLPTILGATGLPPLEDARGINLLSSYSREYITMEYMGSGCPDIRRRKIKYCIRNRKYKIVYAVSINDDFEDGTILEIYNLKKDIDNINNLSNRIEINQEIQTLLGYLKSRHSELRIEYEDKLL